MGEVASTTKLDDGILSPCVPGLKALPLVLVLTGRVGERDDEGM